MLDRLVFEKVPPKHHTVLRDENGRLRATRSASRGIDSEGPYTIVYHQERPQALHASSTAHWITAA